MLKISSVRTFEEKISLYNVIFALILGKNSINSDSKTKFRTFIFQLAFMTAILALPRLLGKSSSIDKSWQWSSRKYWRTIGNNHWCFALNDSDNPFKLFNHADTKIVRSKLLINFPWLIVPATWSTASRNHQDRLLYTMQYFHGDKKSA